MSIFLRKVASVAVVSIYIIWEDAMIAGGFL